MKPGDIVLIRLPQVGSPGLKLRPAIVLALLPGSYQNVLICGVSTKLHQLEAGWDELISSSHPDFGTSGLHHESSIRLSYLYAADSSEIAGVMGFVEPTRLARLKSRLAKHLS